MNNGWDQYELPRKSREETLASIQTDTLIAGIKDAENRVNKKLKNKGTIKSTIT